jgi:hypothetical protein
MVGILTTGCQTMSSRKSAIPANDTLLPPPPPPNWEGPGKTTSYAPAQPDAKLVRGMEVKYAVTTDQQKQAPVLSGPAQIGPDGTMVIGPYGQFRVEGLTVAQACQLIEKQLQPHLPNPHVQLQLASGNQPANKALASGSTTANATAVSSSTGNSDAAHHANYVGPAWNQPAAQPTTTTAPITPMPHNKRGPILTAIFGPRY